MLSKQCCVCLPTGSVQPARRAVCIGLPAAIVAALAAVVDVHARPPVQFRDCHCFVWRQLLPLLLDSVLQCVGVSMKPSHHTEWMKTLLGVQQAQHCS